MSWVAASYGSVEDIEIGWTLIAFVGICYSVLNVGEAWKDVKAMYPLRERNGWFGRLHERWCALSRYSPGKNGRLLIARAQFRVETARLLIQVIFFAAGITSMILPGVSDATDLPTRLLVAGIVIRWGLILASLLVTYQSIENRRLRVELRQHFSVLPKTKEEIV